MPRPAGMNVGTVCVFPDDTYKTSRILSHVCLCEEHVGVVARSWLSELVKFSDTVSYDRFGAGIRDTWRSLRGERDS